MVTELDTLKDAVSLFTANACQKLRAQNSHSSMIQVFLRTNRFRPELPQYNPCISVALPQPNNDTVYINKWTNYLVEKMFKEGYQYKKAGIMLSEISPSNHRQMDMWETEEKSNLRLMCALDKINSRYGRGTVSVSTQGANKTWHMKQERKSPNYTTDWNSTPFA
jgi:DNA polymerase V